MAPPSTINILIRVFVPLLATLSLFPEFLKWTGPKIWVSIKLEGGNIWQNVKYGRFHTLNPNIIMARAGGGKEGNLEGGKRETLIQDLE